MKLFHPKTLFTILQCLFFTIFTAHAQEDSLSYSNKSIDELMLVMEDIGSRDLLNQQSVKAYIMPPRKQENLNMMSAYAAATVLEYYLNVENNFKINLSPDFIALNLSESNQLKMSEVLNFLIKYGTVNAAVMPYGLDEILPSVSASTRYKINLFLSIFNADIKDRRKVFETRKALMRGNPVLVELEVPPSFFDNEKKLKLELDASEKSRTTLPMIVVAYDEDLKTFELLSFLGKKWGRNGYIQVSYDQFSSLASNGFVLVPNFKY